MIAVRDQVNQKKLLIQLKIKLTISNWRGNQPIQLIKTSETNQRILNLIFTNKVKMKEVLKI